jgi:hypothetical protein
MNWKGFVPSSVPLPTVEDSDSGRMVHSPPIQMGKLRNTSNRVCDWTATARYSVDGQGLMRPVIQTGVHHTQGRHGLFRIHGQRNELLGTLRFTPLAGSYN